MTTTRIESDARHILAAQLRDGGCTYRQIAEQLGYDYNSGATGHAVRHGRQLLAEQNTAEPYWMRRRFGTELEHAGVAEYRTADALVNAGLEAEASGYTHRVSNGWKVVPDGSCGSEAVSPILRGKAGWDQVKVAMQAVKSAGGRVTRACGMHIHLDMADMTGEQIARVVELYVAFQADTDNFVSPSRRSYNDNRWCRAWYSGSVAAIARELRETRTVPVHTDRYRTLNVASFTKYGTLEFRQHQGCLNFMNAKAWGTLCMALVEVARQDRISDLVHGAGFLQSLADVVGMTPVQVRKLQDRSDRLNRVAV